MTFASHCSADRVSTGFACEYCEAGFAVGARGDRCVACPHGRYSSEEIGEPGGEPFNRNPSQYQEQNRSRLKGVSCAHCEVRLRH